MGIRRGWVTAVEFCEPDQCVDIGTVNLVHHFDRVFDLAFVRLEVHDENESVVVLDFLHGRLRSQRKLDYAVTVNLLDVLLVLELVHGLTCVLRVAEQLLRLRTVKVRLGVPTHRLFTSIDSHSMSTHLQ